MKKILLFLVFCFLTNIALQAQDDFFATAKNSALQNQKWDLNPLQPTDYKVLDCDFAAFKAELRKSPGIRSAVKQGITLTIPMPDGTQFDFQFFETQTMHPDLAAKFPDIKTYMGFSPENPAERVALTVSHLGVDATIHRKNYIAYLKPMTKANNRLTLAYFENDLPSEENVCGEH